MRTVSRGVKKGELLQDPTYALRTLRKNAGLEAIAMLILSISALG